MTDRWTVANLRSEIHAEAGKLSALMETDDAGKLSDAEMRAAYREGVNAVRIALKALG